MIANEIGKAYCFFQPANAGRCIIVSLCLAIFGGSIAKKAQLVCGFAIKVFHKRNATKSDGLVNLILQNWYEIRKNIRARERILSQAIVEASIYAH